MGEVKHQDDGEARNGVWTIIVAAGSGSRFGGPKQLVPIAGKRVLDWSLSAAEAVSDGVVVVVPAAERTMIEDSLRSSGAVVVTGGDNRSESVRNGLSTVPTDASVIVVHDGARPAATPALFIRVIDPVRQRLAEAAIPVIPVVDSIRWRNGAPVDRDLLVAVQTPQAFDAAALRRAHADEPTATDDAALVEAAGGRVRQVPGLIENQKLTVPSDLPILEAVLTQNSGNC